MSDLAARLAAAGCIAADEEAALLLERGGTDTELVERLVQRRLAGEPLAWITGHTEFCGVRLNIDPGVYVPRPHTEIVAETAAARLPAAGTAVDLCTGSGAIAAVLTTRHPAARVFATDLDPVAVTCARGNGVDAREGDLAAPLPADLTGHVDVVTAVTPYVPSHELGLLQRDTFRFESTLAYAGGDDGLATARRVLAAATSLLRDGGSIVLELGAGQAELLTGDLTRSGYIDCQLLQDDEGDERGLVAIFAGGRL